MLVLKRRDLTLYAFDRTHAHAVGLSPRRLEVLLLGLLAVTVVVALQAVGVVLVVAMLITPGATALLLCERMGTMLVVSPLLAGACAVGGLYASFFLDTSSAGTVVVAQGLVFAVAYVVAPRRGLLATRRRRRAAVSGPASSLAAAAATATSAEGTTDGMPASTATPVGGGTTDGTTAAAALEPR